MSGLDGCTGLSALVTVDMMCLADDCCVGIGSKRLDVVSSSTNFIVGSGLSIRSDFVCS